jgi:hypothetical protein
VNFSTEILDIPVEILGMPKVILHVSSTAPVMAFVGRLSDVAPDGSSALVCSGVLNGTRRDSLTDPEPLEAGEIYELVFDLDCTAWRFEAGHQIRLSISSADFPNLWPTPHNGVNRIYRNKNQSSCVILPLVPVNEVRDQVSFPPSSNSVELYRLSPDKPVWQIVEDLMGDRVGLKTLTEGTARVSDNMEVTNVRDLEIWASNQDPSDVVAIGKHLRRIVRTDGETTVDAVCNLRSTKEAFHLTIDLDIKVNGIPHHQDRWVKSFPRVLL